MKDSMKITVKYQFVYMLLMQVAASGVAFVFGLVAFWYFLSMNIAKEIISVIFIGVNFAMLYIPAKNFAIRDNKSYTPLKPIKRCYVRCAYFRCYSDFDGTFCICMGKVQ